MNLFSSESERRDNFPVTQKQIFLGHAGVTVLPRCVADAMIFHVRTSCENHQEFGDVLRDIERTRKVSASLIGADKSEIALLGPTALGLSLFANGLTWEEGDEVICYEEDYPSNVYPWMNLASLGVKICYLKPKTPGQITPELVEAALTPRTKLVALASCHYLSGWRIDVEGIGRLLRARNILFSLDAIQTVGAFPVDVEHVDFLSADAHKWMLGPMAIGIVYVARRNFELCRPTLLGAWNVRSPEFITRPSIEFVDSAQRYEPGVLNVAGIYGMKASLEMLEAIGIDTVSKTILETSDHLRTDLVELGFEFLSPPLDHPMRSGIVTVSHPQVSSESLFESLNAAQITASLRMDHGGKKWLRFSPHFYNTCAEMDRVVDVLQAVIPGE